MCYRRARPCLSVTCRSSNGSETETACRTVRAAGFRPVPHVPVRLLPDAATADRVLGGFVDAAQVDEVLLISGDYRQALGPYSEVLQVIAQWRAAAAWHETCHSRGPPRGAPQACNARTSGARNWTRRGWRSRRVWRLTLLTQFFFEQGPFLDWVRELRSAGVQARLVGGLAGPTKLSTLIKFALRCGAGASMRVLTARPAAFTKLLGDHGPESVLRAARAGTMRKVQRFRGCAPVLLWRLCAHVPMVAGHRRRPLHSG